MRNQIMERPKKVAWKSFFRIFTYSKGYRLILFASLFFMMTRAVLQVLGDIQMKPFINALKEGSFIVKPLLLMGLAYVLSVLFIYVGNIMATYASEQVVRGMRKDLFDKSQSLPMAFFDAKSHGELLSRYTSDVESVLDVMQESLPTVVSSFSNLASNLVAMVFLSPVLTVIAFVTFAIMVGIIQVFGRMSAKAYSKRQADIAQMNGYVEEMISGQRVIKAYAHEQENIEAFGPLNEAMLKSSTKAMVAGGIIRPLTLNLGYVQFAIIAVLGSLFTITGQFGMELGTLTVFLELSRKVQNPLVMLAENYNTLLRSIAGAQRVFAVLDETPELDDGTVEAKDGHWIIPSTETALFEAHSKDPRAKLEGGSLWIPQCGHIEICHASFSYVEGQLVIKDLSLFAKPRQKIALVGSTGAGKTTIANLLTRFYDLQEGVITLDGIDIRKIKKHALRSAIGMVLQEVTLFEGSIKDNIQYGAKDEDEQALYRAAKQAYASSFIESLEGGYDSLIAPEGANLSEGQRQLISIARAARHDPLILVLDEATSSVDTRTERLVEQGMDGLMKDRTTLVIAHRLSTVRHADAILIIEAGKIIERGTHEELMALKGRYYALNQGTEILC